MKFQLAFADAARRIDPPVMRLLSHLPSVGDGPVVTVVPITRLPDFRFSGLPQLTGPWILICYSEFGPDWNQESSWLWGKNRCEHTRFAGDEWKKFNDFIMANPPLLTFQRELLRSDVSDTVLPIDYPNYSAPVAADTEAQFQARPIDVLFNWGLSSHERPGIHADIFAQSVRLGYEVCSQWDHLDQAIARKGNGSLWAAIHTPHYARLGNVEMIRWFSKAKIVVAAPGEGRKSFRCGEINNSIVAMRPDKLAYSVEVKGVRLQPGREAESLHEVLRDDRLYETYLLNHAAADALRPARWILERFIAEIQKRL